MSRQRRRKAKDIDFKQAAAVNKLLDQSQVDLDRLRLQASGKGLGNRELRSKAWLVLLGLDQESFLREQYLSLAEGLHRDTAVVEVDVQRSLWSYTEGWTDAKRGSSRAQLKSLLNAAIGHHNGQAFYYQGLHDIASVLLFEIGERPAFLVLRHLVRNHLRDFTRPTLEPVMELLELLMPLLEQADLELYHHVASSGAPPYFALSWLITWFAHNVPGLEQITRLFDLFMASHPLMPLYVAVIAMRASRITLLKCELDAAEMHRALHNLSITAFATADELAHQATLLFGHCPPAAIICSKHITMDKSCAAEARQVDGYWQVPEVPQPQKFGPKHTLRRWSYQGLSFAAAALVLAAVLSSRAMTDRTFGAGSGFLTHMPPLL
ncbi:hypothetical protein WJX84_002032 [Apatococcus fuscideae]|uniref:Rab-GAP TBC domain-containing protein n=1 Tax=Apatococcus fuscideae TaxID=2026836 RepID=A0AAW1TJQ0_9CHLO